MIANLRRDPYERGLEAGGNAMDFFADFDRYPDHRDLEGMTPR